MIFLSSGHPKAHRISPHQTGDEQLRTRHRPRRGALVAWPLRQDQWSTSVLAGRRWALPSLTVPAVGALERGARDAAQGADRLDKTGDPANQSWLPDGRVVVVADSGFSALELIAAVRWYVCFFTRLRLDASLFEPAPKRRKGQMGRPALKGKRRVQTQCRAHRSENCMDIRHADGLVRWSNPPAGVCLRHRRLVTACPRQRSGGFWCVIRLASVTRRRFFAPTLISDPPQSSRAWCPVGGSRQPSKRHANLWASRPSGNSPTWPPCAPHPHYSVSILW
jgi:hypothetical protein